MPAPTLQASVWSMTAKPAAVTPLIENSVEVDVCVVGAGYAGLSTALHLAEVGTRVIVLEAEEPGFGGSGRNGGQVIAGLKADPCEIEAAFPAASPTGSCPSIRAPPIWCST